MIDLVKPNGNEKELLSMARKLGYSDLCFVFDERASAPKDSFSAALNPSNTDKARKKFDLVISDSNARESLEKFKIDLLDCSEPINHIIAKIAADKDKMIGFNFSSVLNAKKKYSVIARMIKSIELCQKYGVKTAVYSLASSPLELRNPRDLVSFFSLLGMKNPLKSMENISERIEFNRKLKSGKIFSKGVERV